MPDEELDALRAENERLREALNHRSYEAIHEHSAEVLESISDAFFALDETWHFTYVNREAERLLERRRVVLLGKNVWREFPEAVSSNFYRYYHQAVETGQRVEFLDYYAPLERWLSVRAYPLKRGGLAVYFTDVTAQQEAQERLRQSEKMANSIINALNANICIVDREGRIMTVNDPWKTFAQQRGATPDSVSEGANYLEVCARSAAAGVESAAVSDEGIRAVLSGDRDAYDAEYAWNVPVEEWFKLVVRPVMVDGRRHAVIAHYDITERKMVEQRLKDISEMTFDYAFSLRVQPNGELVDEWITDEALQRISGYKGGEVHWSDIAHPEDMESIHKDLVKLMAEECKVSTRYRIVTKSGEVRHMEGMTRSVANDAGGIIRLLGAVRDITRQVQMEEKLAKHRVHLEELVEQRTEELRRVNEELRALSRHKDEWVSNVSHELRSPLTSLKTRYHNLTKDPTLIESYLPVLQRETQRLANTIEDLLKLSRWDQGKVTMELQRVDLQGLLRDFVYDRQLVAASKGLTLTFEGLPTLSTVMVDTGLIEQVVDVIVSNALYYVPAGGAVVVGVMEDDARVGFRVSDDGPGVIEAEHEKIFERFYRGEQGRKSRADGTGLGLALAREIVEHHGGALKVRSQPGEGATFQAWFPRSRD